MRLSRIALNACILALGISGAIASAAPTGSKWRENYFPNVELRTQDGSRVRFYDLIKDKVVAINFIFTRCTGPCPGETANLRKVQKLLGDRVGRDVFMYTISIDPEKDTPAVLKRYAKKFNTGPGWTFLTGKKADIQLIRTKLGVYSAEDKGQALSEHSLTFVVGNETTGQWMKRNAFDQPQTIAHVLGTELQNRPVNRAQLVSYNEAPRLPNISPGEDLFRSRCVACHALSGEDSDLGPGLAGVTKRRSKLWLTEWLKHPDKMLERKDPTAIELFNRYQQLRMPNLNLSDAEVADLIHYMDAK